MAPECHIANAAPLQAQFSGPARIPKLQNILKVNSFSNESSQVGFCGLQLRFLTGTGASTKHGGGFHKCTDLGFEIILSIGTPPSHPLPVPLLQLVTSLGDGKVGI